MLQLDILELPVAIAIMLQQEVGLGDGAVGEAHVWQDLALRSGITWSLEPCLVWPWCP